jgi:hypothetical protein
MKTTSLLEFSAGPWRVPFLYLEQCIFEIEARNSTPLVDMRFGRPNSMSDFSFLWRVKIMRGTTESTSDKLLCKQGKINLSKGVVVEMYSSRSA